MTIAWGSYEEKERQYVLSAMTKLYIIGTRPVMIMVNGKISETKAEWVNDEAKRLYNEWQAYLSHLFDRAMRGVKQDELFGVSMQENGTIKPIRKKDVYF